MRDDRHGYFKCNLLTFLFRFPLWRGEEEHDGVSAFLDFLGGGQSGDLSSLQAQSQQMDGLPVEKDVKLDGLPVEPEMEIDGLPVEPSDPYVDPQVLLTQKRAASLIGDGWWKNDPPTAAAA